MASTPSPRPAWARSSSSLPERALATLSDRRTVAAVWALGGLLAVFLVYWTISHIVSDTVVWSETTGRLLDYRDTVVHTTHFLLDGGNPYDPDTFLKAYPWSQEFDPYAPAWLLLAFPFGLMPLKVGGTLFVVLLYACEVWMAVRLAQWVSPRHHRILAPVLFLWMMVWPSTRIVGASTLIVVAILGVCLALRRPEETWWTACLVALSCIKPQFGLPMMVFLLALGRWRTVLRGVAVLVATSLVPLVACIRNAGGVPQFADSIRRDIAYASSASAPTGLGSEINFRTDVPGILVRLGFPAMPGVLQLVFVGALVLIVVLALHRLASAELATVLMTCVILLLPVHSDYDFALMWVAAGAAVAWWRSHPGRLALACAIFALLPLLHMHQVTMALGLSLPQVSAADVLMVLAALCCALVMAARTRSKGNSWAS